jgi:tRNA dimethylallyltransferase
LNIGVARPSDDELKAVKHHLIANLSVEDYYNVSMYEQDALRCLDTIFAAKDIAVCVGGSGLYIDALCRGIADLPDPDPELRKKLREDYEKGGIEEIRFQLKFSDPEYYNEVDLANPIRILRALEVCYMTGKPFSAVRKQAQKQRPFDIIKIGMCMERELLNDRINKRVDIMIGMGLLHEVEGVRMYRNCTALNTVGYKEIFEYMDGSVTLQQAIDNIKTNTRRYAKRQMTWFRRYNDINWIETDKCAFVCDQALQIIENKN